MGSNKTPLSTFSDVETNHVSQAVDEIEESPNRPVR